MEEFIIVNGSYKRLARFLLATFIVAMGTRIVARAFEAAPTVVFPPGMGVLVNHSFEPFDLSTMNPGETITVTVDIVNNEDAALHGFYYSDQVPNGWFVDTVGVSVNGEVRQ